jgi:hypothetical protein
MADPAVSVADATRAVLLAIRMAATAETAALAERLAVMGIAVDDVHVLLSRLELAGLVERRDGTFPGWRLTADGRAEGERLLAVEVDTLGVRRPLTDAYDRFVALNGPLLRVCTDWQLRDADPAAPVVNDHRDEAFDRAVIDRLGGINDRALPVCDTLARHLGRFSMYRTRFTHAMDRIRAGDLTAVDTPLVDSYHSIWFELHDHLLATLGRDRASEPLPPPAVGPRPS